MRYFPNTFLSVAKRIKHRTKFFIQIVLRIFNTTILVSLHSNVNDGSSRCNHKCHTVHILVSLLYPLSPFTSPSPHSLPPLPIHFPLSPFTSPSPHSLPTLPIHFPLSPFTSPSPHSLPPLPIHFPLSPFTSPSPHSLPPPQSCIEQPDASGYESIAISLRSYLQPNLATE